MWISLIFLICLSPNIWGEFVEETMTYGQFPTDFMWAAATASYQVEGAWDVDGKSPNIWDTFVRKPGTIVDGSTGDVACNSYYFYERDVEMLKNLGVSHYRFSISWSRMIPTGTGNVNPKGIEYYRNVTNALKAANIQPMVTLYHWDLPQVLEDQGGWLNPAIADWFEAYADACFEALGNDVKLWITLNEPWVVAYLGYGTGSKAPGIANSGIDDYQAAHNLLRAHAKAYRLYETKYKPTQNGKVGITLNIGWTEPKDDTEESRAAAERSLQFNGGWFANPVFGNGDYPDIMKQKIKEKSQAQGFPQSRLPEFTAEEMTSLKGSADFFGLNYYSSDIAESIVAPITEVSFWADKDVNTWQDGSWYGSASSWLKITPFGMRKILNWISQTYNYPDIVVTENGYSEQNGYLDDFMRIYYYRYNINNVLKAIQDGSRVIGYTAWSLMDNFEWERGYSERFGIHYVNFTDPNRPRVAKDSATYYARIIQKNGFVREQFCDA